MESKNTVLCGANAYEMKYYFNEQFNGIPESIKNELHVLCVLFTEEVGGVFVIAFEEDGNVVLETNADDDDIYYDEVSSGLMIAQVRVHRPPGFLKQAAPKDPAHLPDFPYLLVPAVPVLRKERKVPAKDLRYYFGHLYVLKEAPVWECLPVWADPS